MNRTKILMAVIIGLALLGFTLRWSVVSVAATQDRGQGTRPPQLGRYYALLIAVQNYRHPSVTPLDYPLADAQRVQQVLTADYTFEPQNVTLLPDPDREAILTALGQLADGPQKLRPDDHLLIFYAGHGYWDEKRRQGYWLPAKAQRGNRANWISNSDLRDAIRAIPARHTLLVSDACFSGGIFIAREAFTKSAAIEELSRLSSRNAMTSGALTTVPDRSVFVEYLVKRLSENREAYLPAIDLFSQLRTAVINNSPRQPDGTIPTPRYGVIQEAGDEGGDFVFVRRSAPKPTPTPTPTPVSPFGELASKYANELRRSPGEANKYKEELQSLVDKLQADPQYEKRNPAIAALVYRMYSAALLIAGLPDPHNQWDFAFPWLQRSIKLGANFKDHKRLREAGEFIRKILEEQPSSIPLRSLLKHAFRVAMVEASEQELEEWVRKTEEEIKRAREAIHGQNEDLSEKQTAAIELGFFMGSKLALATLPLRYRGRSYADLTYSEADLHSFMGTLGITGSQAKGILNSVQTAMRDVDFLAATGKIMAELDRITVTLKSRSNNALIQVFGIGFILGHCLELGSFALASNPTDKDIASFAPTLEKYKASLPNNISRSGLPDKVKNAIQAANIQVKSVADMRKLIEACKKVLQMTREKSSTPAPTPPPRPTTSTLTPKPSPVTTTRIVAGVPLVAISFQTANTNAQGRVVNKRTKQCRGYVEDLGNGVKLEIVEVPAGEFEMGSNEQGEKPIHRVRVDGFLMGRYEVTRGQWKAVMGSLPPGTSNEGDNLPIVNVSWDEAQEFIKRLNAKLRLRQGAYRLPSEAEWEYAARAGATTPFAFGPTITPEIVNYDGNYPYGEAAKGVYRGKPVLVGSLGVANAWGLFDLHGNVWEWCEDDWVMSYSGAPLDGRARVDGPSRGAYPGQSLYKGIVDQ